MTRAGGGSWKKGYLKWTEFKGNLSGLYGLRTIFQGRWKTITIKFMNITSLLYMVNNYNNAFVLLYCKILSSKSVASVNFIKRGRKENLSFGMALAGAACILLFSFILRKMDYILLVRIMRIEMLGDILKQLVCQCLRALHRSLLNWASKPHFTVWIKTCHPDWGFSGNSNSRHLLHL